MKRITNGAKINVMSSQIKTAWDILESILDEYDADAILVSGCDGEHMEGSLHYIGNAHDYRKWVLEVEQWEEVKVKFIEATGGDHGDYDFVISANCIHIEYQPKAPIR